MVNTEDLKSSDESLIGSSPVPGTTLHGKRATCIIIDDLQKTEMSIPKPHEPEDYESKPLRKSPKPNLKDFDHEANWITSPTNPAVEINTITGRMRTKDFSKPGNYPKSI